jgi:hypothetical protein
MNVAYLKLLQIRSGIVKIKKLVAAGIAGMFLFASAAHSALVDAGDFSTDTASGLDWLKLNKVNGLSYAQVASGTYGYTTAGWRFATFKEMVNLFEVNIGSRNGLYGANFGSPNALASEYFAGAEDLVVKLGMNLGFSDDRAVYNLNGYPTLHQISVQGFFDDGASSPGLAEATAVFTGDFYAKDEPFGRWLVWSEQGAFTPYVQGPNISSFLVRDSVAAANIPEPSSSALLGLGLFGIALASSRALKSRQRTGMPT